MTKPTNIKNAKDAATEIITAVRFAPTIQGIVAKTIEDRAMEIANFLAEIDDTINGGPT